MNRQMIQLKAQPAGKRAPVYDRMNNVLYYKAERHRYRERLRKKTIPRQGLY